MISPSPPPLFPLLTSSSLDGSAQRASHRGPVSGGSLYLIISLIWSVNLIVGPIPEGKGAELDEMRGIYLVCLFCKNETQFCPYFQTKCTKILIPAWRASVFPSLFSMIAPTGRESKDVINAL